MAKKLSAWICMEDREIPWRIQMERFIPLKIFRKKVNNTFRGITFFPFLSKRPKFSVPFVWITSARLQAERKRKIYRYFVNGTIQSRSCFRCQKIYQCHLTEIFHWNFRTNGKRSLEKMVNATFAYKKQRMFAPDLYFSVLVIYLRNICRVQICANPFFHPVKNAREESEKGRNQSTQSESYFNDSLNVSLVN